MAFFHSLPAANLVLKNAPKYEKSALTPARAEVYLAKLLRMMETEKLFTNSDLKLQDLAQKLDIPPRGKIKLGY